MTWEQGLLLAQQPYVQRQLGAGVAVDTIVRDLIQMGADPQGAAQFVATVGRSAERAARYATLTEAVSARAYLSWAALAGVAGVVAGALLVIGIGLALTTADLADPGPSLAVLARIEAATLLPGVVVGVLLRRRVGPGTTMRPVAAAVAALVGILVVRYLTLVEVMHEGAELKGRTAARLPLLTDGQLLGGFIGHPTNVYALWSSSQLAPLILWDIGFVGLAAFVAVVFSRVDR
jgi:hypothetical protein